MHDMKRLARIIEVQAELAEAFPKLDFIVEALRNVEIAFNVAGKDMKIVGLLEGDDPTIRNQDEQWKSYTSADWGPSPVAAVENAILGHFEPVADAVIWLAGYLYSSINETWSMVREVFLEAESSTSRFTLGHLFYLTSRKTYYEIEVMTREGSEGPETRTGLSISAITRTRSRSLTTSSPYTCLRVHRSRRSLSKLRK